MSRGEGASETGGSRLEARRESGGVRREESRTENSSSLRLLVAAASLRSGEQETQSLTSPVLPVVGNPQVLPARGNRRKRKVEVEEVEDIKELVQPCRGRWIPTRESRVTETCPQVSLSNTTNSSFSLSPSLFLSFPLSCMTAPLLEHPPHTHQRLRLNSQKLLFIFDHCDALWRLLGGRTSRSCTRSSPSPPGVGERRHVRPLCSSRIDTLQPPLIWRTSLISRVSLGEFQSRS